ncbi:MAG: VCBS repeat-containing protein, partial [Actinomycetota bacterium]
SFSVLVNNTTPGADIFDFLLPANNNFTTGVPASGPSSIIAVDLDGDGREDAVVANATNANVRAHINTTTPGAATVNFAAGFGFGFPLSSPAGLSFGDVTLDGRPDVVVANRTVARLTVLRNITTLGGGPPAFVTSNVTSGGGPRGTAIGDLNGDGKNDIVAANGSSSTVTVILNGTAPGGLLNLPTGVDFATDLNPSSVALLDFNGDGRMDIATANQGASNVTFYRNVTGFGATTPVFVSRTEVATAVGPAGIFVQDMNADGRPDVITSAFDSDQVTVLINSTGLGGALASFNSFSNTPVGDGPEGVAVGDYNGDGRPDVAAAAKSGSVVSVIRNVTTP